MKYIESPFTDAFVNMALEEYVFESLPQDDEYFMLWQNQNAIVVGKYQNTIEEVNAAYVKEHDIQVVRRLSGGGAMYQDLGNLNFTFVVNQHGARSLDFSVFIAPVVRALASLGVQAQQSSRNDIVIDGKKFSGNAQYNKKGRTMHHGTLLYSSRLDTLAKALNPRPDKTSSKGIKSVRSRVTNIADHLPGAPPMQAFKQALVREMFHANPLQNLILREEELQAVSCLAKEKYQTYDWNWGRSPAYNIKKQRRYAFGEVQLYMQVEGGRLKQLHLAGDFFGNGEVAQLAEALQGCVLDEAALARALAPVNVGRYILGMDAAQLVQLLLY